MGGEKRPSAEKTEPPIDLRLPGALVRTALSSEQTLMSWVRTSLSMISFGFSVTQFFHYLEKQRDGLSLSTGARRLGIALICVGTVSLVFAVLEHIQRIRHLKKEGLPGDAGSLVPLGSAVAMLAIGIVALASVFVNWHW